MGAGHKISGITWGESAYNCGGEMRAYLGNVSFNVGIWSKMRYNGVYFALGMP